MLDCLEFKTAEISLDSELKYDKYIYKYEERLH